MTTNYQFFYMPNYPDGPLIEIGEWDTGQKYTRAKITQERDRAEHWRSELEQGRLPKITNSHRPPMMPPPETQEAPLPEPLPPPIPIRG